jgi:hypothetical protein
MPSVDLLVSNNPYALGDPLASGSRPTVESGQLGIIVLDAPGGSPRNPGRAWSASSGGNRPRTNARQG